MICRHVGFPFQLLQDGDWNGRTTKICGVGGLKRLIQVLDLWTDTNYKHWYLLVLCMIKWNQILNNIIIALLMITHLFLKRLISLNGQGIWNHWSMDTIWKVHNIKVCVCEILMNELQSWCLHSTIPFSKASWKI